MSRYEQRLADDKAAIRERIVSLGRRVEAAVAAAVDALLTADHARSYKLVIEDLPVNRESRAIDRTCHAFVARHLPSSSHLRFVSAVMRMNVELERIGDYAVSISRHAVQLESTPGDKVASDMRALAGEACAMLHSALDAFSMRDAELARKTKPIALQVERSHEHIYLELTQDTERSLKETAALLAVFNKLERVSDQAKNICEKTLFELLGETKPPRRYDILFVDATCTLIAPLAEMLARKAFPDSGNYQSAGFKAGDAFAPELATLVSKLSLDAGTMKPNKVDVSVDALAQYDVIVSLNGNPRKHIREMPYHTVLLEWDLPKLADAGAGIDKRVREIAHALSAEIHDLMTTMRGEDAT